MILRTYLLLLVMFKYKQRDYMKSERKFDGMIATGVPQT